MSRTFCEPEVIDSSTATGRWMVLIFDNESNTFEDVIMILMKATGCSAEEAYTETWEAHHFGKAPVHFSARSEAEIVAAMIGTIGVRTLVKKEWEE
jgi:ATP-dependent Clp protease adaptor protein ClpS